jgi:hypothetical protein
MLRSAVALSTVVPVKRSLEMVQTLRGHGGEVREVIYTDAGHGDAIECAYARIRAIRLVRRDACRRLLRDPGVPRADNTRHPALPEMVIGDVVEFRHS